MLHLIVLACALALAACSSTPTRVQLERPERMQAETLPLREAAALRDEVERIQHHIPKYGFHASPVLPVLIRDTYRRPEAPTCKTIGPEGCMNLWIKEETEEHTCFSLLIESYEREFVKYEDWSVELTNADQSVHPLKRPDFYNEQPKVEQRPLNQSHFAFQTSPTVCTKGKVKLKTPFSIRARPLKHTDWPETVLSW